MPTSLLICATLAVCVVLPISASAKEELSTLVRREFQLTHPCPSTRLTTDRCPGYVKDYIVRSPVAVAMWSPTCSGRRSALQRQKTNGKRRAALGRSPDAVSIYKGRTIPYAKVKDGHYSQCATPP